MQSYSIQSTQELISLVKSDFESNIKLIDKHLYFIDTLIRHKADKKAKYLSSEKLKKTFGDRQYLEIINYFEPEIWWLENLRTRLLKESEVVQGIPYIDVDYCQFID